VIFLAAIWPICATTIAQLWCSLASNRVTEEEDLQGTNKALAAAAGAG